MFMDLHTLDGKLVWVNMGTFMYVVDNGDETSTMVFMHGHNLVVKESPQWIKEELVKLANQAMLLARR